MVGNMLVKFQHVPEQLSETALTAAAEGNPVVVTGKPSAGEVI